MSAEPVARVTRESIQRVADAIMAEPFRPAPSQPVTCEHGETTDHFQHFQTQGVFTWCPGPPG